MESLYEHPPIAARSSISPQLAAEQLYALGYWLVGQERYADAAVVFRLGIQAAPRDERIWLGLGLCHEKVGQFELARQLYGLGSVAAEPAPRCLVAAARVLAQQDDAEKAAELYEAALGLIDDLDDERDLHAQVARERRELGHVY